MCASHMPGISVAPAPSITVAPVGASAALERPTPLIRLPCTSTLPAYGNVPVPSRMRTLVKRVLASIVVLLQAAQRVAVRAARSGGARWNSPPFMTDRMRDLSCRMVMSASGSPSTSSRSA